METCVAGKRGLQGNESLQANEFLQANESYRETSLIGKSGLQANESLQGNESCRQTSLVGKRVLQANESCRQTRLAQRLQRCGRAAKSSLNFIDTSPFPPVIKKFHSYGMNQTLRALTLQCSSN